MSAPAPAVASQDPPRLDSQRAQAIWKQYEQEHDLTGQKGRTAGIDPETGRIWFADDILDIVEQMMAEQGFITPLLFVRIGYESLYHKRGCLS